MSKDISPVGWYVGSYMLRFIEVEQEGNFDPEQHFLTWENTVLVKAENLDQAYSKIEQIGQEAATPYLGGTERVLVQWYYEGITELLPVYEELEDGAEIMWLERPATKLKNLRKLVCQIEDFKQDK